MLLDSYQMVQPMNEEGLYTNSVFEQGWWLDVVAPGKWSEVILQEDDSVVLRLPYMMRGNVISMPPFTQTLGPWIKQEYRIAQKGNSHLRKQKELIAQMITKLPSNFTSFDMSFDSLNTYILPYRWHGFTFSPGFSYRINNLQDLDALYERMSKTVIKNIKTARNKVEVIESSDSKILLTLLSLTFSQQGRKLPFSPVLIEQILDASIMRGNGKLLVARDKNNNYHSCAFLLYDDRVCYYLFGGSDSKFRSGGAQSLVLWEAIKFASTVSAKFDFEGSMVEGIENFFRQFGGEQVINYHVTKRSFIDEIYEITKPRIKRLLGYKI